MSCEEDVLKIAKRFEKMLEGKKSMDSAPELLETLAKLPITLEILTKTRIGMTVNEIRKKTTDQSLAKKAKALIKDWKSLLSNDRGTKGSSPPSLDSQNSRASRDENSNSSAPSTPAPANNGNGTNHPLASTSIKVQTFPRAQAVDDEMRQKSIDMLTKALRSGELPDGTLDPEDLAARIEAKLFEVHRGTTGKYPASLRSRVFNLRDKKNQALRENVLTGTVSPEKFAVMTSEEMASDDIKKMREKFTKDSILEHQMSTQEGTPSDMFRCGKCGKNNCTYTQVQTRSADEPMTTFVFCRECGNRWKFC